LAQFNNGMKAKVSFTWGTGIAIFYSVFALTMLLFVVFSFRQKIDLVSPDYYAKELAYQQQIDAMQRNAGLLEQMKFKLNGKFLELIIPMKLQNETISGEVDLFCPADNRKDMKFPFETRGEEMQRIDFSRVSTGRYTLKLTWKLHGNSYYNEEILVIP
jgi:hypothetical protein